MTPAALLAALRAGWSAETGRGWRADNPARGQCDVTALVVQDWLGGEILKTPLPEGWHFYNRLGGRRLDLTESQFAAPIAYQDLPSDRAEALAATLPGQYETLAARLRATLAAGAQGGPRQGYGPAEITPRPVLGRDAFTFARASRSRP